VTYIFAGSAETSNVLRMGSSYAHVSLRSSVTFLQYVASTLHDIASQYEMCRYNLTSTF